MVVVGRAGSRRVFYARPEIEVFRDIERFSDYRRTKDRMQRALNTSVDTPPGWKRYWGFVLSDRGLKIIVAATAVASLLFTAVTFVITSH